MFEKTLYGKDKAGGLKVWTIRVSDTGGVGAITITYGKEGGRLQQKHETVSAGKQGRTPLQQAIMQAEAKIKKNVDKGYRETIEELSGVPLLPMLALDYHKNGHRLKYPLLASPKLDGVRCLARLVDGKVELSSRTGQPYSVPHVEEALLPLLQEAPEGILAFDGELYCHGYALQDITSAVKRTNPQEEIDKCKRKLDKVRDLDDDAQKAGAAAELAAAEMIADLRSKLEFHLFDVVIEGAFYILRNKLAPDDTQSVHIVRSEVVQSEDEMIALHSKFVDDGYEGIMLRDPWSTYESGKRSAGLQKYKMFKDAEFRVVGLTTDKDGGAVFIVSNNLNDNTFQVVMGTHEYRRAVLEQADELIGKWLTVKFQTRYKDTLLPQFPVGVGFRECDMFGNPLN